MRICNVEGCEKKVSGRGLCNPHYQMWYKGYTMPISDPSGPHRNTQEDLKAGYISDVELGWLAGLWEGEGHFGYDRTQLAHLNMTDYDVIAKMKTLIERTFKMSPIHLIERHSKRKNEQVAFGIQTYGATARAIMKLLLPLMGNRRRAQIWRALNRVTIVKVPNLTLADLGLSV